MSPSYRLRWLIFVVLYCSACLLVSTIVIDAGLPWWVSVLICAPFGGFIGWRWIEVPYRSSSSQK